jgi:hypothetical protein
MASDKLEGVGFELIPIDSKRIVMRFNSLRRGHIRLRKSNQTVTIVKGRSVPSLSWQMVVCHTDGEEKRLDTQKRPDSAVSIAWSKVALKL